MRYGISGGQQQAGIRYTWRGVWRSREQSQVVGTSHRILTGMDSEVAQDIGDVAIDGAAADEEDLRDLAVRLPVSYQIEHLALTRGQCGRIRHRAAAVPARPPPPSSRSHQPRLTGLRASGVDRRHGWR